MLPSVWAASTLFLIYYAVRRNEVILQQARTIYEVERRISHAEDIESALTLTVESIHAHLHYERVLALMPTKDADYASMVYSLTKDELESRLDQLELKVVANAGPGSEDARDRTMKMSAGISGRAILTGNSQRVNDVTNDVDYQSLGLKNVRSELNVPVRDLSQPSRIIANLSLVSGTPHFFKDPDERAIERLAGALSRFWATRSTWDFHRRLIGKNQTLSTLQSLQELLQETPTIASELLDARAVAVIHLGFGTAVPRACQAKSGDAVVTVSKELIAELARDPYLELCIRKWETRVFYGRKDRPQLGALDLLASEVWDSTVDRAVFVVAPIGTPNNKTGLLIAVYESMNRDREQELLPRFDDLARTLSPYFTLAVARGLRETLLSPKVRLHAMLRDAGIRRDLHNEISALELEEVRRFVGRLFDVWDSYAPPDFSQVSLDNAIESFIKKAKERKGAGATWTGVASVEREPHDLKLVIFRLVVEAVLNARVHSNATKVDVSLERADREFVVRIEDDGQGFELPRGGQLAGDGGMGSLLEWIREYCGEVRTSWEGTQPGRGAHLKLTFLVLPPVERSN